MVSIPTTRLVSSCFSFAVFFFPKKQVLPIWLNRLQTVQESCVQRTGCRSYHRDLLQICLFFTVLSWHKAVRSLVLTRWPYYNESLTGWMSEMPLSDSHENCSRIIGPGGTPRLASASILVRYLLVLPVIPAEPGVCNTQGISEHTETSPVLSSIGNGVKGTQQLASSRHRVSPGWPTYLFVFLVIWFVARVDGAGCRQAADGCPSDLPAEVGCTDVGGCDGGGC